MSAIVPLLASNSLAESYPLPKSQVGAIWLLHKIVPRELGIVRAIIFATLSLLCAPCFSRFCMPVLFKIFNGLRQQSVCLLLKEEKSALKASQEEYDEMVHRIDETDKEVLSLQSIKKEVRILKKKYADFDTKQGEGSPVSAISTDSSSNGQIEKFLLNGSGMNRWSTDVLKGKCLEMIEAREKQLNQCTQPLLEKVAKIRLETESLKEKISDNGQHYGVVLSNSQYLLCFSRTLLGLPLGAVR